MRDRTMSQRPARFGKLICAAGIACLASALQVSSANAAAAPPSGWVEPPVRIGAELPVAGTNFGWITAISGNVMVVGVPSDKCGILCPSSDISKLGSGTAYVVRAPGGDWTSYVVDLYLKEPPASGGPAQGHFFGIAVAIDGPRMAISMRPTTTGRAAFPSKVFVYLNDNSNPDDWSQVEPTVPADTITDPKWNANDKTTDNFGSSLAIAGRNLFVGDMSDDGKNGTTGSEATPLVTNSGAVNVYYDEIGDATGYPASVPNLKLKQRTDGGALAVTANAYFGQRIAFSGNSLVVATGTTTMNKVTVYTSLHSPESDNFSDGTIKTKALASLDGVNQDSGDNLGYAVDIDGANVIVGAPSEDSSNELNPADNTALSSGAAYVFNSPDGSSNWSNARLVTRLKQQADVGGTAIAASNKFGAEVAIKGSMIAVGANESNSIDGLPANGEGKVSLFAANAAGGWGWHSNLAAPESNTASPIDRFGSVVQLDDSSGTFRCFVSAPYDDGQPEITSSGSIYVYQGSQP